MYITCIGYCSTFLLRLGSKGSDDCPHHPLVMDVVIHEVGK